ncbi:hypothetical protein [Streptomyces chrestomyceticus]|uniref:hypothetical protein n=1 Tax=Streptomyces chrestomyceticus TaxID=68185 RepID=UPI0033DC0C80
MSIISAAAPLRPEALAIGLEDAVAQAFGVVGEVQALARLGVRAEVTVDPGGYVTVALTLSRETAGLLPGLAKKLAHGQIRYPAGAVEVSGTMYANHVIVRAAVDRAHLSLGDLADLVLAVDPHFPAYDLHTGHLA